MAEQTFRSPGFFEQEIDIAPRQQGPQGVPAGIIGTAEKGPAFVPVTVGSFADFETKFGTLDPDRFGPYAVREFLKHRTAVTYMRVLGAGSVDSASEISDVENSGIVSKAGFILSASHVQEDTNDNNMAIQNASAGAYGDGRHAGCVQFICAQHYVSSSEEPVGFPIFSDNDSTGITGAGTVNLVRGVVFTPTGSRMMVLGFNK